MQCKPQALQETPTQNTATDGAAEGATAEGSQLEGASSNVQASMVAGSQGSTQAEAQAAARERGMIQRQLRGVAERISLATSRLQVEDAASSLTALEQLYQVQM